MSRDIPAPNAPGPSPGESPDAPLVRVGTLAGAHGLAGEVRVRTSDEAPDWLGTAREVFLQASPTAALRALRLASIRLTGPGMARARLEGLDSRTALEKTLGAALGGGLLYIRRCDLPPPPPEAFHVDSLIGLRVMEADSGREVGVVRDVLSASGSDFLEITPSAGGEPAVIPFNRDFCPQVDIAAGTLHVAHLSGFFDPPSA